jgi:hypothetical protein
VYEWVSSFIHSFIHQLTRRDKKNEMEVELEPRVKPLQFKVKAMSRESPSQKAINVLDSDLRSHWSTATNTKEWILLQLNVSFPLSFLLLRFSILLFTSSLRDEFTVIYAQVLLIGSYGMYHFHFNYAYFPSVDRVLKFRSLNLMSYIWYHAEIWLRDF